MQSSWHLQDRGNAIRLKLTILQAALKKLQIKSQGKGSQPLEPSGFRNENIFVKYICFVCFFVITRLSVYFISIEIFWNQKNNLANTELISGGRFLSKIPEGGRLNKKVEDHWHTQKF